MTTFPSPRPRPFEGGADVDLAVIGGGLLGATVALFAARGGMSVALLDRGPLCREASGVNAGTLTMQMTRVALIPYALKGHEMWATARDWLGHDVGVQVCDGLSLAYTEAEAALLTTRAGLRRDAGAPITLISPAEARAIEPGLGEGVRLAAHCAVDGFANAYQTGGAFRAALLEAGVAVREQSEVDGVAPVAGGYELAHRGGQGAAGRLRAARIVLAGGVWTGRMLAWLGIDAPIKALVNQLGVTERVAPVMRTVLGVASGLLSLKQYPHGTVVVGGGWQGVGDPMRAAPWDRGRPAVESLVGNLRLACHAIPALREARLARAWTGYEAETPDAMPLVGPVPGRDGAYVCASIHSGYTSGPYIARLLADHILGKAPEAPLFPLDRFAEPRRQAVGVATALA